MTVTCSSDDVELDGTSLLFLNAVIFEILDIVGSKLSEYARTGLMDNQMIFSCFKDASMSVPNLASNKGSFSSSLSSIGGRT